MPFTTLKATIADERSNSYVTADEFQDYWAQHFDTITAGLMAAIDDPSLLLVRACRTIETIQFTEPIDLEANFHLIFDSRSQQIRSVYNDGSRPQKYNYYQHLQFPRTLDVYQDGTLYVPEEIKGAQCEQAAYEFTFDTSTLEDSLQGVDRSAINVGGVSLSQHVKFKGSMISPIALNMLKPYIFKSTLRLQRA